MARKTIPKKAALVVIQQLSKAVDRCDLVRMTTLVAVQ